MVAHGDRRLVVEKRFPLRFATRIDRSALPFAPTAMGLKKDETGDGV
jgi:hypothetical protein